MPAPNPFANLPPISFATTDVGALTNAIVSAWQAAWLAETGETIVLGPSDRRYHFLLSLTGFFVAAFEQLDASFKQDLLPLASGGFLVNDCAIFGPRATPLSAVGATCPLQFTLPATLMSVSDIPAGTIVGDTSGTGLLFSTETDLQIPIGLLTGTVNAVCTTVGTAGNGLPVNTITTLVGWSGSFLPSVTNTQTTGGGANAEDLSAGGAYAQRMFGVTDSYSNAGSYGAYQFFAESADPSISQVTVSGPEDGLAPGNVLITVLCQNGAFPNNSVLTNVANAVNPNTVRDLCANVTVSAPTGVPFTVNVSYWVPKSQANNLANLQTAITGAVNGFIQNAETTLGGDIDPSILSSDMVDAGAVRVVVTNPGFIVTSKSQVPQLSGSGVITYMGLI
jgi:phage-related baseplate assembly protein